MYRQQAKTPENDSLDFSIVRRYNSKPNFPKPKIVGYWSVDGARILHHDTSQLRYYIPYKKSLVYYDLNDGLSNVKRRADSWDHEKLRNMLKWILLNKIKIIDNPTNQRLLRPDFICYRGHLSKILKTPYDMRDGWILCAVKFRGSIYLCAFDTEEDKIKKSTMTNKQKKMTYWGKRFEQYVLSDNPYHQNDTSTPVDESEEFCCVFEGRLNNHTLLFAAEMDGLCSKTKYNQPLSPDKWKFMELKTDKMYPTTSQEHLSRRFKSLSWWAQSYLVGVENIVIGYRDDLDGIVRRLATQTVRDLEARSQNYWNSKACLNFCSDFLSHIKYVVVDDYSHAVYKFERVPRSAVIRVTKHSPSSKYAFLPESYTTEVAA